MSCSEDLVAWEKDAGDAADAAKEAKLCEADMALETKDKLNSSTKGTDILHASRAWLKLSRSPT